MKDIVITVGTALGSTLELSKRIKIGASSNVYALCTDLKTAEILQVSKYIDEVFLINLEKKTDIEYLKEVQKWYENKVFTEKPILYFTADIFCFYVDTHRDWFEDKFELCLPSSYIVKTYTEKGLAEKSALNAGLTVPKTEIVEKEDAINVVLTHFSFPVILKPRATYLKKNIDFKIKVIDNKEEFRSITLNLINKGNSLLCQEFIPGGDDTSYYYLFYRAKDGSVYENMGKKTLQSTSNGGIMLKGLVEYNSHLSQISRDFLNKIDYKGIGGIEFKKYNGNFYFIEMSTRLEGFFKIAEISNSPLSLLAYYDLSDKQIKKEKLISKQKDNFIYVSLFSTLVTRLRNRQYISFVTDCFSALFHPKVKLNIWSFKDPLPFLVTLKKMLLK